MFIGNLGQFTKTSAFTARKYYATQVHKEILSLKIKLEDSYLVTKTGKE
jgi:hypothetical protein